MIKCQCQTQNFGTDNPNLLEAESTEIVLLSHQTRAMNLPLSGYSLIPGYRRGQFGLPVEVYLSLYAVKDKEKKPVRSPKDLARYVSHIDSEEAAWCFLRLFTSIKTHFFFQKEAYTVDLAVSANEVAVDAVIVSPEVAQEIGYESPKITLEKGKYFARRDLIRADPTDYAAPAIILRRQEIVSEEVGYLFIEDIVKGEIERRFVAFPCYE